MTGWLAANMVWAGLTLLLVLLIRRPVAHLFGAGPAYALWLLPPARLLMPPLPAFGADLPSLLPPLDIIVSAPDSAAQSASASGEWPWAALLLAFWAAGAAVFLVAQWLGYRRFLTRVSLSSRSLGHHDGLPVVESAAVQGPLALGLLDRRIVVPADFAERYSPGERRLALDHEAVHHRRGDIWWNLVALLFLAAQWFNPIAWLAFRAFREDQELACDSAVAARAEPAARHDYALALIKSASRPGLIAACPLNHADQLKRRLRMMKHHRPGRLRMLGGIAAVTLVAGISAGLGGPGLAHPHPEGEAKHRERVIIMDHKGEARSADGQPLRERSRQFVIRRDADGELVLPETCRDGERLVDTSEGEGNDRTRIVMCSRGEADAGTRLERLQRARERLSTIEALDGERRERVLEVIDREIARLRGQ